MRRERRIPPLYTVQRGIRFMGDEPSPERMPMPAEATSGTVPESEKDHLYCPVDATLDLLTQRWTLHVLRTLLGGARRFNEIAQENNLNAHTLRDRLKSLAEEGIVTRTVVSTMPPNVEYALTEKGYALNRIFEEIADWGRAWMTPPVK
jgi:DNA-binding HxlR family transcriptional regulator